MMRARARPAKAGRFSVALAGALALGMGAAGAAVAEPHRDNTSTYTALDTLTATIVHDDGTRGVLSVQAGLDVADPRLRKLTTQYLPRLRDAYVQTLATYAAGLIPGTAPNIDQIGQQLQHATDRILGRPGTSLLMGTVLIN